MKELAFAIGIAISLSLSVARNLNDQPGNHRGKYLYQPTEWPTLMCTFSSKTERDLSAVHVIHPLILNLSIYDLYQRWMRRRSRNDFYDAAAAAARRSWPAHSTLNRLKKW